MNPFKLDDVNKRNSSTWTACNNDSKSKKHRMTFLSMFGGEFVQDGKYVKWQLIQKPQPVYVPKRLLYFIDPNKQLLGIDNMTDYCDKHNLSKSAMYEVLRGERKSHKGHVVVPKEATTDPVPETDIDSNITS